MSDESDGITNSPWAYCTALKTPPIKKNICAGSMIRVRCVTIVCRSGENPGAIHLVSTGAKISAITIRMRNSEQVKLSTTEKTCQASSLRSEVKYSRNTGMKVMRSEE